MRLSALSKEASGERDEVVRNSKRQIMDGLVNCIVILVLV